MIKITSTLEKIAQHVFTARTCTEAKEIALTHLQQTNVKHRDIMIKEIQQQKSLYHVQRYICNALLKYEGLGVGATKEDNTKLDETE